MADSTTRAAAVAAAACCVSLSAWSQTTESVSISGVPPATVQAEQAYRFAPDAVAVGPLIPHFEIENQPPWASFSWAGQLTGTPAAADAGVYSNIVISIVAGEARASLPAFSIAVDGAGSATIYWTPPTTNDDGTVLTDLAGYQIYVGSAPNRLVSIVTLDDPELTSYVVEGLSPGLKYFAITAINSWGIESALSAVVGTTLY